MIARRELENQSTDISYIRKQAHFFAMAQLDKQSQAMKDEVGLIKSITVDSTDFIYVSKGQQHITSPNLRH